MANIEERFEEGCMAIELGRIEKALNILQSILDEKSDYYPALNKIGVIYVKKGDLTKAEEFFEQALEINQNYAPALVNIGNILKERENLEGAEKYYLAAIEEDIDYPIAYHNIAVLYKEKNNFNLYMKYLKEYKRAYKRYSYNSETYKKTKNLKNSGFVTNVLLITFLIIVFIYVFTNR